MSRPPLPPFNAETAAQKARMAEDAWNSRDPERVALWAPTLSLCVGRKAASPTTATPPTCPTPSMVVRIARITTHH